MWTQPKTLLIKYRNFYQEVDLIPTTSEVDPFPTL